MHIFRYNWTTMHRIFRLQVLRFLLLKTTQIYTFVSLIDLIILFLAIENIIVLYLYTFSANEAEYEAKKEKEKIYCTSKSLDFTTCGSTICMIKSRNLRINVNFYTFFKRTVYILFAFGNLILSQVSQRFKYCSSRCFKNCIYKIA